MAAITKFISIHVFHSWLMGALPLERCADRMGALMGNGLWVVFRQLKFKSHFFTFVFESPCTNLLNRGGASKGFHR